MNNGRFTPLLGQNRNDMNFGLQEFNTNPNFSVSNQQPLFGFSGQSAVNNAVGTPPVSGLRESLFGGADSTGWLTGGMQVGQGALNSFLGLQNYRMGRRQLGEARKNHATNLSNQARTTNMSIYDRFQSRYGGDAGNEALLKWGVSGQSGQTGYSGANTAGGSPTTASNTQSPVTAPVDTNRQQSSNTSPNNNRNRNVG